MWWVNEDKDGGYKPPELFKFGRQSYRAFYTTLAWTEQLSKMDRWRKDEAISVGIADDREYMLWLHDSKRAHFSMLCVITWTNSAKHCISMLTWLQTSSKECGSLGISAPCIACKKSVDILSLQSPGLLTYAGWTCVVGLMQLSQFWDSLHRIYAG